MSESVVVKVYCETCGKETPHLKQFRGLKEFFVCTVCRVARVVRGT